MSNLTLVQSCLDRLSEAFPNELELKFYYDTCYQLRGRRDRVEALKANQAQLLKEETAATVDTAIQLNREVPLPAGQLGKLIANRSVNIHFWNTLT